MKYVHQKNNKKSFRNYFTKNNSEKISKSLNAYCSKHFTQRKSNKTFKEKEMVIIS